MLDIQMTIDGLLSKDDKFAYQCLKKLEAESDRSSNVYPFFDIFVEMLEDRNSYVRTRGIILLAANTKWDKDDKIDAIIDKYLEHIMDDKPITARQCIKTLPLLVKFKPNLRVCVMNALIEADPKRYTESMRPLLERDIQKALGTINRIF